MTEILDMVKDCRKVLIIGCKGCVTVCNVGGSKEVGVLASALKIARKKEGAPLEVDEMTLERQCDPEFLDTSGAQAWTWDLHLDTTSALIDAGDSSISDPDGGASDMGAYGGPAAATWDLDLDDHVEWWLPGPFDAATSPGLDCDDRDETVGPGHGC